MAVNKKYRVVFFVAASTTDVGLDADLAQALRLFFKDVKTVQAQITEIKEYGNLREPPSEGLFIHQTREYNMN